MNFRCQKKNSNGQIIYCRCVDLTAVYAQCLLKKDAQGVVKAVPVI